MEKVTIKKEGILERTYWHYDEQKDHGEYKTKIEDEPTAYLLHELPCEPDEGVTFKDILKLVNKDLTFWDLYVGNWCKEFTLEGLNKDPSQNIDLDYIELYWDMCIEENDDGTDFNLPYKMEVRGRKINDEITYSLSFIRPQDLNFPVKIKEDYEIIRYKKTSNSSLPNREIILKSSQKPSLFQIIYSLFWEISFYGGPEKRDETSERIKNQIEEIKNEHSTEQD